MIIIKESGLEEARAAIASELSDRVGDHVFVTNLIALQCRFHKHKMGDSRLQRRRRDKLRYDSCYRN